MMKTVVPVLLFLSLTLWVGCQASGETPPEIHLGEDICDECHMIISDLKTAAIIRTAENIIYRFDDLGCFINYIKKHNPEIKNMYVYDYIKNIWQDPYRVRFYRSPEYHTPMNYGIIATSEDLSGQSPPSKQSFRFEEIMKIDIKPIILEGINE